MSKILKAEVVVIGAGVVGCSIAMQLSKLGKSVVVLEKEGSPGTSTSARSSGVVHSGIYFPRSYLKSKLCIEGQPLLYRWAEKNKIPYKKTGKLVVSFSDSEDQMLDKIHKHALENRCAGVTSISKSMSQSLYPFLNSPSEILHCAETGIIDPQALTASFWRYAVEFGADFKFRTTVKKVHAIAKNSFEIETENGRYLSEILINSSGLDAGTFSDSNTFTLPQVHLCRGDYFSLKLPFPISHLVYPVKDPSIPGLGVHLTLDLLGNQKLGPDATYIASEPVDLEAKKELFQASALKLFKLPKPPTVEHCGFGIRPKLSIRGEAEKDFYIHEDFPGWWNLVGIESPGLTASLRLGEYLRDLIFR